MRSPTSLHFTIALTLLAATLTASRFSERRKPEHLARPLDTIESTMDGWTGTPNPQLAADVLQVLKPTSYLSRTYHKGTKQLELFIAFYAQQQAGESLHSPKNCLPGSGWEVLDSGAATLSIGGKKAEVNTYHVQNGAERLLVAYWYQSRDRVIASEYRGKMWLVRDTIVDGRTAASLVRLTMLDQPGALEDVTAFASALIPQMQRCFAP